MISFNRREENTRYKKKEERKLIFHRAIVSISVTETEVSAFHRAVLMLPYILSSHLLNNKKKEAVTSFCVRLGACQLSLISPYNAIIMCKLTNITEPCLDIPQLKQLQMCVISHLPRESV